MKNRNPMGLTQQVRIIGGQWRHRKLQFPNDKQLRPTPDRVRETLFNWLQHDIVDAVCLDAFAGSGALGLEALSRGAKKVTFIDKNREAIQHIQKHLQLFNCDRGHTQITAIPNDHLTLEPYDIIFLDPPFQSELIAPICQWLLPYCHANTLIYLETSRADIQTSLPPTWQILKTAQAGKVHYFLLTAV